MIELGEDLSREERQQIILESLLQTVLKGKLPSARSRLLAQQWVNGEIPFSTMAWGVYEEAVKEQEAKRNGR